MSIFDPTPYQDSPNGPLNKVTIDRLIKIKERSGMSYAVLGDKLSFSGPFTHNLINKSANVSTQHIERVAAAIERLENPDQVNVADVSDKARMLSHSFHLRPDLQVVFQLPADLTDREAERLSRFVQTLPVA